MPGDWSTLRLQRDRGFPAWPDTTSPRCWCTTSGSRSARPNLRSWRRPSHAKASWRTHWTPTPPSWDAKGLTSPTPGRCSAMSWSSRYVLVSHAARTSSRQRSPSPLARPPEWVWTWRKSRRRRRQSPTHRRPTTTERSSQTTKRYGRPEVPALRDRRFETDQKATQGAPRPSNLLAQGGKVLPAVQHLVEQIALLRDPVQDGADGEPVRGQARVVQFFPGNRRRDRGSGCCTGAVWRDEGFVDGVLGVVQPSEAAAGVDLPLPADQIRHDGPHRS